MPEYKTQKRSMSESFGSRFIILLLLIFPVVGGMIVSGYAKDPPYPRKSIVWIVPYQSGGGYDTYSRAIARVLPNYLPKRVKIIIKNVSGAGGRQGTAVLYRSKPDGYTIGLLNPVGLFGSDLVTKSTQYDMTKFTYLATCSRGVPGLYVAGDSDLSTIEDLQKQERIRFATGGRGSGTWLWGMLVRGILGVPVSMISGYLGTSEYITAVMRNDAEALVLGFSSAVIPYCQAGALKPVLMFSMEPIEWMPDVPIAKGTRFEKLAHLTNDRVIAAPPGVSAEIAGILEKSLMQAMNDPHLKDWSKKTFNPLYFSGAEGTLENIQKTWALLRKYIVYFKD